MICLSFSVRRERAANPRCLFKANSLRLILLVVPDSRFVHSSVAEKRKAGSFVDIHLQKGVHETFFEGNKKKSVA